MMKKVPDHQTITIIKEIEEEPDHVFKGLTDETLLEKWFCPLDRGFTAEVDFTPATGSIYQINMIDTDGTVYAHSGMIEELVPSKKLVFTWSSDSVSDSLVTFILQPKNSGTEVKLIHKFRKPEDVGEHKKAWSELLDNLRRMLED